MATILMLVLLKLYSAHASTWRKNISLCPAVQLDSNCGGQGLFFFYQVRLYQVPNTAKVMFAGVSKPNGNSRCHLKLPC